MKKVSIIVPIYNQEQFLEECIESIIHQTYSNLEIILVDDGSIDNSYSICEKYRLMDDRILVIHKENGGLSSARNAGLDVASGDYIMFCDGDDFYLPNSCELLEREITSKQADYVIGNYIHCTEEGTLWENPIFDYKTFPSFRLSIKDYNKSFYVMSSSVCNKIFRKSFIDKLALRFVEGVPAEDAIFTTYCFIKSKAVYYISDLIYVYRQRNGTSISTCNHLLYFKGISKAYQMIYQNFLKNNQLDYYHYFYLKTLFYIMYKFIDSKVMTNDEKKVALQELSWFCHLIEDFHIQMKDDLFFDFIRCVNQKDYDTAIEIGEKIHIIRSKMSDEEKLKMSKIPPSEYHLYLPKKRIALVVDREKWAFDIGAHILKDAFQKYYDIDIFVAGHYQDDLFSILEEVKDYDMIHFFWRKTLLQFGEDAFREKVKSAGYSLSSYMKVCSKISTGVYDHLFIGEDDLETYLPIFKKYTKCYYTCSERLKKIYDHLPNYPKPWGVIHDTFDPELYDGGDKERFSKRENHPFTVGWIGNSNWNVKYKDFKGFHSILIPVLDSLIEDGYSIKKHFADKNILFRTNEEMPAYYQELDVCVITSYEEGTPRPLLEAMASGVPIITTDVGIVPEVLGPNQKEFVIGKRNDSNDLQIQEALKEKLIELYHNPSLLIELSKENYLYSKMNGIDVLFATYQKYFDEFLK